MLNVLSRHNTLFNFYPSHKHLVSPKNDFNYISRAKQECNLYNTILYNRNQKNNIKNNQRNRITFNSTNRNWNYLNKKETKSKTNNRITNTTSINFWKEKNNNTNNIFNYDKYLEINRGKSSNKKNNDRYNTKCIKDDKDASSPEQKFKINSKLFELFINDYEKRIKKSLEEMGMNSTDNKKTQNENEKNNNNDYENIYKNNYELYEKNFFNLPFLNNLENPNNENDKNFNSINENNNEIFHKEPNSHRMQSAIKERLIKANSFERNKTKEEIKSLNKKIRTLSSSPYTINATIHRNTENKISHYEIGKVIGKGAYAIVKMCKNKITQEKFAMKIYEKKNLNDNIKKKCVSKEIEILKKLNHPNIVKLYDTIITDKYIILVQELVNGISLREYYNTQIRHQKNISENKFKFLTLIFKQIFSAFDYIHKKNIAHRDIKLENILLTRNNEIKIIDFGFGHYNPRNYLQKFFCGTPNYMAPEIIMKKEYDGEKADMWSLGILLYKLFCADFPFKGKNEKDLYKQIIKGKFKIKEYVPDNIKYIIEKILRPKPHQRINCEQVLQSHWLKN